MSLFCTHFNEGCSGCSFKEKLNHPPVFDEVKAYFKINFDKEVELSVGKLTGWRTRAKLAVRGTWKNPIIGLFKANSHEAVAIPSCPMHHDPINQAVERIKEWIINEKIAPYHDLGMGLLRYIQLSTNQAEEIQAVLVFNSELAPLSIHKLKGGWHSLWCNFNTAKTNTIFSDHWELIEGEKWIEKKINGQSFLFHPATFIQANPEMYGEALKDISAHFKGGRAVEFYGGVGTIGLSLAKKASSVLVTEYNPQAQACFDKNNPEKLAQFQVIRAEAASHLLEKADVVIVDPPRKGMDPALLEAIVDSPVKQIIYLSCGFKSLQKEALELKAKGFHLAFAKGYLFFPGTDHIETLTIFERAL